MRKDLQSVIWNTDLKGKNTENAFSFIKDRIENVMKKHLPTRKVQGSKRKTLWMNSNPLLKVRKKNAAYKRYLSTREGKDYDAYAKARNQAKWEIRKAKREYEKKIATDSKNNPKAFFKYANSKLKTRSTVPNLDKADGTKTTTDSEKAEELNKFFSSTLTKENMNNVPFFEDRSNGLTLQDTEMNESIVMEQLKALKVNKSPGPDGLHPRILNELSKELKEPLTLLFRKSLEEGVVPKAWKEGQITPIFKKGKNNICDNYRPVSLTSIVCKVMEKIIRAQTIKHLNQFISSCQHGFIGGRSCITQLLDTIDTWSRLLDGGSAVDAIYLDFSKQEVAIEIGGIWD